MHLQPPSEQAEEIIRLKCSLAACHLKLQQAQGESSSLRAANSHLADQNLALHRHLESISMDYKDRMDGNIINLRKLAIELGVSLNPDLNRDLKQSRRRSSDKSGDCSTHERSKDTLLTIKEEETIIRQIRFKVKESHQSKKLFLKEREKNIIRALAVQDGAHVYNYIHQHYGQVMGGNNAVINSRKDNFYDFVFNNSE